MPFIQIAKTTDRKLPLPTLAIGANDIRERKHITAAQCAITVDDLQKRMERFSFEIEASFQHFPGVAFVVARKPGSRLRVQARTVFDL